MAAIVDKSFGAVLLEALYAVRMEVSFIVAFLAVWAGNRLFSGALPAGKRRSGAGNGGGASKKASQARFAARELSGGVGGAAQLEPASGDAARRRSQAPGPMHLPGDLDVRNRSPAQLQDAAWVSAAVQRLSRSQMQKAIELYRNAISAGLELRAMPKHDAEALFVALVSSAARLSQAADALQLMRECRERGPGISVPLLSSATKLLTSKHFFKEVIAMYDHAIEDKSLTIDDRAIWSCLLFCSVESRMFARCTMLFQKLKALGKPSQKDFGNMIRAAASQGDWQGCLTLIKEMRAMDVEIDSVIYNTALSTCVTAGQMDAARVLLDDMESSEGVADVITYNTLAKGYGRAGQLDKCFELYDHMLAKNIEPSQVTYGILLDCCINEKQVDKAAEVFDTMTKVGCVMNTVLYTTLIKGFARAEQVDQAMKVYEQMRSDPASGVTPDLITFSILIKANCDAGRMETSLQLLETMLDLQLVPDEVVFNNLLSGCVRTLDAGLGRRLYNNMVQGGLRPSNATFSILIRLYSACKLLEEAVEVLKVEPSARGVKPESRLYVQLAQACLRERQGRRALEVYKMMLTCSAPTAAMHSSLLGMCVKLNMLDTAVEILTLAAESKGRVERQDADGVREAALRKKKGQLAEAASEAIAKLRGSA
mmetsp:Transcript_119065/g.333573  ORF Transcript_119065/g.333573 Transcript_119065/m.333573 type:complete len:654 (+) Transcript_119065:163-2124(+)|eukprot:CAMPEP_0176209990 /NCGR_PEP_ID=MMETSP0121_2-20121125/13914_1 /TAXON_ID=160619 /ORGANISM="Kryptoperidinium foliaceum, Strain CCMP 1326" /LENGTH=653 /DNA_ID=CAMNT_0017549011 /DNA_START=72 /DNA_END=2033 /DNA_ORIENTATION=+